MNWFYALNGKQAGPVTEEELKALYGNGTISANTLVWHQGMANWTPLSAALPDWVSPAQPVTETAGSPPSFTMATVSTPTAPDNWISEEELLAGDYAPDIGGSISRGWETFFKNPWPLLGGSVLAYVLMLAVCFIPFFGILAQFVVYGPLLGGVFALYLSQVRTRSTDVGLIFSAFGSRFVHYVLVYLVQMLVFCALIIPLIAAMFGMIISLGLQGANKANPEAIWNAMTISSVTLFIGIATLINVIIWVLAILWFFAVPLVADKGYDFWPALQLSRKMVAKHFWWTLLFFIALWAISMLGMLACLIGMFISLPVAFAATTHWYENIFGRLRPKTAIQVS